MSTAAKLQYGTQTDFTITAASLANTAGRVSTQVDLDAGADDRIPVALEVWAQVKLAGAPSAGQEISVWAAYGDDASNIAGALAATDTGYTAASTPITAAQLKDYLAHVGTFTTVADASAIYSGFFKLELPSRRISLYVYNGSGQAFSATAADHEFKLTPIHLDIR